MEMGGVPDALDSGRRGCKQWLAMGFDLYPTGPGELWKDFEKMSEIQSKS